MKKMLEELASSIRYGFATNSSSTHSIILLPEAVDPRYIAELGWTTDSLEAKYGQYGWGEFALITQQEKFDYLYAMLYGQVQLDFVPKVRYSIDYTEGKDLKVDLVEQFCSFALESKPSYSLDTDTPSIDHDSCFSFPRDLKWGQPNHPHVGFIRWLRDQILDSKIVILGGNDNSESALVPADSTLVTFGLIDDEYTRWNWICIDRSSHWLLFDRADGTKLRLPKGKEAVHYSDYPELLDVKITDKCSMNCKFCYQGSTENGKEMDHIRKLYQYVNIIAELQPLEVAIGGGEPMEYGPIWSFVHSLKEKGIVVNMTTRRLDLLASKSDVWSCLSGVGYSTESVTLAKRGLDVIKKAYPDDYRKKLVIHLAVGTMPLTSIVEIMKWAKTEYIEVLLLDYKTDGRGSSFTPYDYHALVTCLQSNFMSGHYWDGPKLGIDTPLAAKFGDEFQNSLKVHPKLFSKREGAFSMYLDLVEGTFAQASYGHEKYPIKSAQDVLKTFRSWHQEEEKS